MTNTILGTVAFAAFLLAAALGRADEVLDHAELDHVYVRITDTGLHPAAAKMDAGQAIGFLNSSSRVARVSFDASIATKIKCRTRSAFQLEGARLASGRIQGTQFASLCSIAPGKYDYRVDLQPGAGTGGELVERSLVGTLEVR
jgi:hypothetical protein